MMAFRSPSNPVGPELIGWSYYYNDDRWFSLAQSAPWMPVYSAFNGLGIYKREVLKHAKYTAYPTEALENFTKELLVVGKNHPMTRYYYHEMHYLKNIPTYEEAKKLDRRSLPNQYFTKFDSNPGRLVWKVYTDSHLLPIVCEHVSLNAAIWNAGYKKFYINPALVLNYADS